MLSSQKPVLKIDAIDYYPNYKYKSRKKYLINQ